VLGMGGAESDERPRLGRPAAARPRTTRSGPVAPSPAVLHRLYFTEQRSIANIAAALGSTPARIQGALEAAGIPRRAGAAARFRVPT
jgi:hypothetical protein